MPVIAQGNHKQEDGGFETTVSKTTKLNKNSKLGDSETPAVKHHLTLCG